MTVRNHDKTAFFLPVFKRWGSASALAEDVGVSERTATSWRQRDSIPAEWFAPVTRAATVKGFAEITEGYLASLAERRRLARSRPEAVPHTGAAA